MVSEHYICDVTWFQRRNEAKCLLHEDCPLTDFGKERCFLGRGNRGGAVQERLYGIKSSDI